MWDMVRLASVGRSANAAEVSKLALENGAEFDPDVCDIWLDGV